MEVDVIARSEQCTERFFRVVLSAVRESSPAIPMCAFFKKNNRWWKSLVQWYSGQPGNIVCKRAEKAILGVTRLVRVGSLVVRQPAATRGDARNCVEQSVRVTGITKVGEAGVRRVDKIRWHVVVVEQRGDIVRRICKKVSVQLLDGRR